jgi:hemolysin D
MNKLFLKIKQYLISKLANNKYLLQDKHSFKPILMEIEDRPVNPVGHFILWAVISVFFISIIWLSVSEIDVVVTARGKLVPIGDVKTIQSTYNGVIKKILVKEGDIVKKGDLLIETDMQIITTQLSAKQEEIDNLIIKIKRLDSLITNIPFKYKRYMNKEQYVYEKDMFDNEKNGLFKQILVYDEKIKEINQKIILNTLEKNGKIANLKFEEVKEKSLKKILDIIPKKDYLKVQYNVIALKNDIKSYENKLNVLKNNLQELEHKKKLVHLTSNSKYYSELIESRKKKYKLAAEVTTLNLQKSKYAIVSPVNGYVLKLDVHTLDGVVTPAQKLLTIVPDHVKIMAQVDVLNKDIGFIYDKMDSLLKIDTFDFQKYGFINATIINISTSSIDRKNVGLVYEVLLDIEKEYLLLNNEKKILKPGMTVSAELKVGKRKVIEFFIYPAIKYLREGMSII